MRTYYRGRRCINASWPTWPQAVWSSSESPLTESVTAVRLYGPLFGVELPVCHFLWDIELCGYECQKVWLLLALSTRRWHAGYSRGCACAFVCVCVCVGRHTDSALKCVCVCEAVRQFGLICRRSVSGGCYHGDCAARTQTGVCQKSSKPSYVLKHSRPYSFFLTY